MLDALGQTNDVYYKHFSFSSVDASMKEIVDAVSSGSSVSTLSAGVSNTCMKVASCAVSCDFAMPSSPDIIFDLGQDLKRTVQREEFWTDGCCVYANEYLGVSTNAAYAYLPSKCHRLFKRFFDGGQKLQTLRVDGAIDNIGLVSFSVCTNMTTLIAGDVDTARSIVDACPSIANLVLTEDVLFIDDEAFSGCENLTSVSLPSSLISVGDGAFAGCARLSDVSFHGDAPDWGVEVFRRTPKGLVVSVPMGSIGWTGDLTEDLPSSFAGRRIVHSDLQMVDGSKQVETSSLVLTVTNVVVHYVRQSLSSDLVVPISEDTGIVNVMTEVKGGMVAVPDSWALNYPDFVSKFGSDFGKALTTFSGKKDGAGNAMFVWQDFVAGTDPTDENDRFTASITIVDGVPVISYTPELTAEQAALRVYKTYGKMKLTDTAWTDITDKTSEERADYNFFKVTVEMK